MQLLFNKGPLFYAEYNIRLFLFLLFKRKDMLVSNDLDTLPANYFFSMIHLSKSRRCLLHDCHEYFRGVPELVGRKTTTRIWKGIEDFIFPKLTCVVAVNHSVAELYHQEYGVPVTVIRNVPYRRTGTIPIDKQSLGIKPDQRVILYQGAVNVERGIEETILAMRYIRSNAILVIAGIGDRYKLLTKYPREQGVEGKVIFLGQIPFQKLHSYTPIADIGISLEKDVSLNYHYSLPNKFLDYIQAGVPVLISPFPEMKTIVDHYFIGEIIENHDPKHIAEKIDTMLMDCNRYDMYKENLRLAADELCWENEEEKLIRVIANQGTLSTPD
jgi:glycosyltransferase involved in cell wall biosynthesis